ncbi:hypothetical protein [Flavobacterium sp. ZT3R25]|uniref:hypothetical protein n=1 Tax=Flavobacterium galactosi TaxID=3398735 RepID=UPI003A89D211
MMSFIDNDSYKPKGSTEVIEVTTYINCSYWLNSKTAQWLRKVQSYNCLDASA